MARRRTKTDEPSYEKLSNPSSNRSGSADETDGHCEDGLSDAQFEKPKQRLRWKTVLFSAALFFAGSCCLVLAACIAMGLMDTKYDDRMWPAVILGLIMFTPGAYYVNICIGVMFNIPGYSCDDIPEFNN